MSLGERIRQQRQRNGLSQEKLAELAGRLRLCLLAVTAYLLFYLAGRLLCVHYTDATIKGWFLENDWQHIDYLYGWLIWGVVFFASIIIGAVLQRCHKH